MSDVQLIVAGRKYGKWKSIVITHSVEGMAGTFRMTVSDRAEVAIREEDSCTVTIDGQTVIDGWVERRSIRASAQQRDITFTGFDRVQALVANSVFQGRWTFRSMDLPTFARIVADTHGIEVIVQQGLRFPTQGKIVVNPGDTAFEALLREATKVGAILLSDHAGGLIITRGGVERLEGITEGANLLSGTVDYDASGRYRRYVVLASRPGSDEASGDTLRVRGEATDQDVRRSDRVHVIRPSTAMTPETARTHADWTARIRAAEAETVSVTVRGWQQGNGELWRENRILRLHAPRLLGIDGDLLTADVTFSIDDSAGEITTMRLVRPDAFTPDPAARVKTSKKWKV